MDRSHSEGDIAFLCGMAVLGAVTLMTLAVFYPPLPLRTALSGAAVGLALIVGGRLLAKRWPKAVFSAGLLLTFLAAPTGSPASVFAVWMSAYAFVGGILGAAVRYAWPLPDQQRDRGNI